MINWMQKHKKSLIPTIWISTIAFVGAGFVGWGAYDMNANRARSIAKVGDISISNQELRTKYIELYNQFNVMSDGRMTQEQAENMHLDMVAADTLIQESLFLNFAKDLGLQASGDDVKEYILNSPAFQENGVFNDTLYRTTIKNLNLTPSEFERNLAKTVTLQKLGLAIGIKPNSEAIEALSASQFIQDRISIQTIYKDSNVSVSEDEVKKFWEQHKDDYMGLKTYNLKTLYLEPTKIDVNNTALQEFYENNRASYRTADDKLKNFDEAKDEIYRDYLIDYNKDLALKTYLQVKKGNIEANQTITADENNFPITELENAKVGDILKPFAYENGNLIVKIESIDEPKPLDFDKAKDIAKANLLEEKVKEILEENANNALKNFNGTDIGFISYGSANTTNIMSDDEFAKFISSVFDKTSKEGYVVFEDKAISYKITEQKFDTNTSQNTQAFEQTIANLMNKNLQNDLLKILEKRYKIERYYRGKDSE